MTDTSPWLKAAAEQVHREMRPRDYASRLRRPLSLVRAVTRLLKDVDAVCAEREPAMMLEVDVCWVVERGLTLTFFGNGHAATFHAQPSSTSWWLTVRDSLGEFYVGEVVPLNVPAEVLDRVWCYVTAPVKES